MVELAVAAAIAVLVLLAVWTLTSAVFRLSQRNEDLVEAVDRAQCALARVQADLELAWGGTAKLTGDGELELQEDFRGTGPQVTYGPGDSFGRTGPGWPWHAPAGTAASFSAAGGLPGVSVSVTARVRDRAVTFTAVDAAESAARHWRFPEWQDTRMEEPNPTPPSTGR